MNILHTVEFYSPSVGGSQAVVQYVSNELVRRGHRVTVATTRLPNRTADRIDGVRVVGFDVAGNAAYGCRGDVAGYQQFLLDEPFDVMMNYAAQQWATDLVFPVLGKLRYPKVLVPCGFSGLFNPQFAGYFSDLPDVLRRYDRLVLHGLAYRDAEFVRAHGLTHACLIPNGASEQEFSTVDESFRRRYGIDADAPVLLTVGSHTGAKGHAATIEAFRRARIGRAVLIVIGNVFQGGGCLVDCRRRSWLARMTSLGSKRVLLLSPPRADVVAAFHAADLFVLASHIECSPLVLFEAMAAGTAYLTTRCGNAEEIVAWSEGGVLVPSSRAPDGTTRVDIATLARSMEELIDNPAARRHLAANGQRAWGERFTWGGIAQQYEQVYRDAVGPTV
jgi:glycosyltransferase involved in cell wall biosynthesis